MTITENAVVSATVAMRPCGFEYVFTEPFDVSLTVIVYSTSDSAP